MYYGDINILPSSGKKRMFGMTKTSSSPLSSTKDRSQSPWWVNLIIFPPKKTLSFSGHKSFIIYESVHMIWEHNLSIPTSTDSVSKDTLILCCCCAFDATSVYTVNGLDFSKCESKVDLLCLIFYPFPPFLAVWWINPILLLLWGKFKFMIAPPVKPRCN